MFCSPYPAMTIYTCMEAWTTILSRCRLQGVRGRQKRQLERRCESLRLQIEMELLMVFAQRQWDRIMHLQSSHV